MKNIISKFIMPTLIVVLFGVSGCSKYLDQIPNDRITIEQIFQKKAPSEQYLASVYNFVDDQANQASGVPWGGCSDEMDITWTKYNTYNVNIGNISPAVQVFDTWAPYYQGIRTATYFMNHIGGNAEILALNGQQLIDQYIAEARCLRAYFYVQLMREYGPVVLEGENELPADAEASTLQLPRSPYDSCIAYVVSQLDKAAAVLPAVPSLDGLPSDISFGRCTKGFALAIKERLLLYAASPLYNGNKDYVNFKNPDGTQLISQTYDVQKWKKAADAAKAVIDLGLYSLYTDPSADPIKSYNGIFLQAWNSEQIFVRKSNGLADMDIQCMPRQASGWCGVGVTQEQVDAYFMNDGKPIGESPLYSETGFTTVSGVPVSNMYINRDPRFYASVIYNNCTWQGGSLTKAAAISFFASGPNGKNGQATDWTRTGYLVQKNVAPQANRLTNATFTRPIIIFRLAEIYLNYVEALNEYDPSNPDIVKYLNLIRARVNMPKYGTANLAIPSSQTAMRTLIWQERRVELAFETHRWFDIRRWKIAPLVMGNMHGMDITKDDNSFYTRSVAALHLFRNPASYFWPIRQYDVDRGGGLIVQNPGW